MCTSSCALVNCTMGVQLILWKERRPRVLACVKSGPMYTEVRTACNDSWGLDYVLMVLTHCWWLLWTCVD